MSHDDARDLVDAISDWTETLDEDLTEGEVQAILRLQRVLDAGPTSGVPAAELSAESVAAVRHALADHDAQEFVDWMIDGGLTTAGVDPSDLAMPLDEFEGASEPEELLDENEAVGSDTNDEVDHDEDSERLEATATETEAERDSNEEADDAEADDAQTDEEAPDAEGSDRAEDEATADETEAERDSNEEADDAETDEDGPDAQGSDRAEDEATADEDDLTTDPDDPDAEPDSDVDSFEMVIGDPDEAAFATAIDDDVSAGGTFATATIDDASAEGAFATASFAGTGEAGGAFAAAADSDVVDSARSDEFFADLERDTAGASTIEFREGPDDLGPTFLPPPKASAGGRVFAGLLALIALGAFVFAGVQLVTGLDEDPDDPTELATDETGGTGDTTSTEVDDPDPAATSAADESGAADVAESDDEPEPTTEPTTAPTPSDDDTGDADDASDSDDASEDDADDAASSLQTAPDEPEDVPETISRALIVTDSGEVLRVDLYEVGNSDPQLLFGGFATDSQADYIELVSSGLAVVDKAGNIDIVDLDDPDDSRRIWDAEDLPAAAQVVEIVDGYGVLDVEGSVHLFDGRRARASNLDSIWQAGGGTAPASQLDAFGDLLPFVVEDGTVRLAVTSVDDNPIVSIWESESQPRAFNLQIDPDVILIGAGEGGIARYAWAAPSNEALTALWDPWTTNRLPAIAYDSVSSESTAVVLNNGNVAMVFESGDVAVMWDAEVSDLRAMDIVANEDDALLLLEGGSVLRALVDGQSEGRGSIWDVTDEALSPATQVLLIDP